LIRPGGSQNPLEPARLACAIATGPYTDNFINHVSLLRGADALQVTQDVPTLVHFVSAMFSDEDARLRMGERAKLAVGTSVRAVDDIAAVLLELVLAG
jgi:3-deoxy-D-manno-octulosonic-acid transferase